MRVGRYLADAAPRACVIGDDGVRLLPAGTEVIEFLALSPPAREQIVESLVPVPLRTDRLLTPLQPTTFRDFVTFERHVEGVRRSVDGAHGVPHEWYEAPRFYFSNPNAFVGPFDTVSRPPGCAVLDYELEVAAVVGRSGTNVTPAQAGDMIVGYTILNDWSARDLQAQEMRVGLGPAKGKDFATTLGPWIVTPDELEHARADERLQLDLEVSVNGRRIGGDSLANMAWSFEEMIAYASRGVEIRAGDVFGSGTCGGGCLAELWGRCGRHDPPPLEDGDLVEMRVECLGAIANMVVQGPPETPIPRARRVQLAEQEV